MNSLVNLVVKYNPFTDKNKTNYKEMSMFQALKIKSIDRYQTKKSISDLLERES